MAHWRRLLAYGLCVAIATPPFAYGQTAPPAGASTKVAQAGMSGVILSGSQSDTSARMMIKWPAGAALDATASISSGIALIRLPRPIEADPSIFARSAPQFVAGAMLSADKRSIRIALLKSVRVVPSRDGNTQAFDFVLDNAPDPAALGTAPEAPATAPNNMSQGDPKKPLAKMINGPAPVGAPRVRVQASVSKEFTRLRLSPAAGGAGLPAHGYARNGDRMAIAMPGQFALDIANLRTRPPARILDSARHSSPTDTALVLDLEPGSVVRHSRDGGDIMIDILPPGTNPNSIAALQAKAVASIGVPAPAKQVAELPPAQEVTAPPAPPSQTSALTSEAVMAPRADPAPSGRVMVTGTPQGRDVMLEFGFESPAAAVIFRRGNSIYALFSTAATFDVSKIKPSSAISEITPIVGTGVAGVRIVAPPHIMANPSALAGQWRLALAARKSSPARTINIERETAVDGTGRVKAIVPDSAAVGDVIDPVVGDTLLLGLALGPVSSVASKRSFLEASLPETFHGLVVTPRTEDFDLRRSVDGFVLVRPNGMALSKTDETTQVAGFAPMAPGFVDYKNWRLGPKSDFLANLNRLRRDAANELKDPNASVRKRLDLARFLLAWDLGAEAVGVLRQLKTDVSSMARSPELIALEGAGAALMGHNKEALDLLTQLEVANDPASQLWAGLAAQSDGNAEEARVRFDRGAQALSDFWPQQRAIFLLANAGAALELNDDFLAQSLAKRARDDAQDAVTKARAELLLARALYKSGRADEALESLNILEKNSDREVAARAKFEKANIGIETGKVSPADSIRALDALRYAWRGDEFEIDVLRRMGKLYIAGGDIRSGLTTMASAISLRPDLPAARALRDELNEQFTNLFLKGGADGMDPIQALALFYDFKDLAPIGPDGDRMVRGLADRLVSLDLLPQATQLLQHQVDKRLDGFPKAQVATDLAAIYLMDRRSEPALQAIWNSRVTMLPEALNAQRRMIEAAALAELGRTEHAIEILEFDDSPDASRLRTELYMRAGDWEKAAENARMTLPPVKAVFEPEEAGEVLRTAIATSMARDSSGLRDLVDRYGSVMGKTAFAEAFTVMTDAGVPDPAVLQSAVASLKGGSPYNALMKRLRTRLTRIEAPTTDALALAPQMPNGPTDASAANAQRSVSLLPDVRPDTRPETRSGVRSASPRPARVAQTAPAQKRNMTPVSKTKTLSPANVQVPRDPPPVTSVSR